MYRSTSIGLVLASRDYKERDRWVTILTPNNGRVDVLAKGVRTLTSKRRSALLPGCIIRFAWSEKGETKILTEAILERSVQLSDQTLERMRDLQGVFEIFFHLSLEAVEQEALYEQAIALVQYIGETPQYNRGVVRSKLRELAQELGFEEDSETAPISVTQAVEELIGRKLKAFAFLHI